MSTKGSASPEPSPRARLEADSRAAQIALQAAREAAQAAQAALAQLESNEGLSPGASDEDLRRHLEAIAVARLRADITGRALAAAEAAARETAQAAQQGLVEARIAELVASTDDVVAQFRETYPRAFGELQTVLVSAFKLNAEGAQLHAQHSALAQAMGVANPFRFSDIVGRVHLRVQLVSEDDRIVWQGRGADQDVAGEWFQ